MDHLIRLLSTTSGADKSFMLVQYSAILLKELASRRKTKNRDAHRPVVQHLGALTKLLSDARTTYRLWDLLSIFQWLRSLNALPSSGSKLVQIERLQVISMLIYYPLEHLYFLASKQVIPVSVAIINQAALYSCRAWAAYTVLHFFHLWEDLRLLKAERRELEARSISRVHPSSAKSETAVALRRLQGRRAALINGLVINLAYAPLTLHWHVSRLIPRPATVPDSLVSIRSLPDGLYTSEAITGLCGLIAAAAQLRAGWKASAATS